jgi:GGDEF domain-containing protein
MPYAGEHAPSIAERVAAALEEWLLTAFSPSMHERFHIYFGWAFYPRDCDDYEQIMRAAEQRLLEHRGAGAPYARRRVAFFKTNLMLSLASKYFCHICRQSRNNLKSGV